MESTSNMSLTERMAQWPANTKSYYDELKSEMRRVTWPPWKQVQATTIVVILSVFAFAAYFWIVDRIVGSGISKLFTSLTK
jgi:preprotein translocase subunit SecE